VPVGPSALYGTFLCLNRISSRDLDEPKESDGQRTFNRHDDASTLNSYFVSRHSWLSNGQVYGPLRGAPLEPRAHTHQRLSDPAVALTNAFRVCRGRPQPQLGNHRAPQDLCFGPE